MKHKIGVLGCGVIYIDNKRVFGSKPYGLFSTVNWSATDEDLKRIADRCLELIADRKTEPTISKMEQVDKDINVRSKDEPQRDCDKCKWYDTGLCWSKIDSDDHSCHYEPKDEPQTERSE